MPDETAWCRLNHWAQHVQCKHMSGMCAVPHDTKSSLAGEDWWPTYVLNSLRRRTQTLEGWHVIWASVMILLLHEWLVVHFFYHAILSLTGFLWLKTILMFVSISGSTHKWFATLGHDEQRSTAPDSIEMKLCMRTACEPSLNERGDTCTPDLSTFPYKTWHYAESRVIGQNGQSEFMTAAWSFTQKTVRLWKSGDESNMWGWGKGGGVMGWDEPLM